MIRARLRGVDQPAQLASHHKIRSSSSVTAAINASEPRYSHRASSGAKRRSKWTSSRPSSRKPGCSCFSGPDRTSGCKVWNGDPRAWVMSLLKSGRSAVRARPAHLSDLQRWPRDVTSRGCFVTATRQRTTVRLSASRSARSIGGNRSSEKLARPPTHLTALQIRLKDSWHGGHIAARPDHVGAAV